MSPKRQALAERLSSLPEEVLDEVAASVDDIEAIRGEGLYSLSDEERAAVRRGLAAVRDRDVATDEEVAAFARRHRV